MLAITHTDLMALRDDCGENFDTPREIEVAEQKEAA